jgi:hypothetical protein
MQHEHERWMQQLLWAQRHVHDEWLLQVEILCARAFAFETCVYGFQLELAQLRSVLPDEHDQ